MKHVVSNLCACYNATRQYCRHQTHTPILLYPLITNFSQLQGIINHGYLDTSKEHERLGDLRSCSEDITNDCIDEEELYRSTVHRVSTEQTTVDGVEPKDWRLWASVVFRLSYMIQCENDILKYKLLYTAGLIR
jgi:hypothetical protein